MPRRAADTAPSLREHGASFVGGGPSPTEGMKGAWTATRLASNTLPMDKRYKAHFLSQLKARMPFELPGFALRKVAKDHPLRSQFAASLLYVQRISSQHYTWLDWFPGEGVEREFFAYLGWSFDPDVLPSNQPGDVRIHSIHEPAPGFTAGSLNVQAVEGRQAIAGFRIATPWDQLYALGARTAESEQKRVMNKAYAEYLAVTEAERMAAVRTALDDAFSSIAAVLPRFNAALATLPPAA